VIKPIERHEQIKFTMGENQQPGPPNETRTIRASKDKGIAKLTEVIKTKMKKKDKCG
jgi:hypothetical protein